MSAVNSIVKRTFKKIFHNLAEESGVDPSNIQLGIYFKDGAAVYSAYKNLEKFADIELGDYVGTIVDYSGGTEIIKAKIVEGCKGYAKELNCDISLINVIMQYQEKQLPRAVLRRGGEKIREIDLQTEFIN